MTKAGRGVGGTVVKLVVGGNSRTSKKIAEEACPLAVTLLVASAHVLSAIRLERWRCPKGV